MIALSFALAQITSTEVTFPGFGGLILTGTFESPSSDQKLPAVLLLPGSGPTDRDGNSGLGVHTDLLKQIADDLAAHGIASLRFDKRAIRHYQSSWPTDPVKLGQFFAWEPFVEDAKAGLKFLRSQTHIDPDRVGMIGHSEGALLTLQVASDLAGTAQEPRAMALLASTARPMGIILHEQIAFRLDQQGAPADVKKTYLTYLDEATSSLAKGKPIPPNPPPGLDALFVPSSLPILGAYCRIDPTVLAKASTCSALVVQGEADTQVSAVRDAPLLIEALKQRTGRKVESMFVPHTSHNLKDATTNADAFEGPVPPGILQKIRSFLLSSL